MEGHPHPRAVAPCGSAPQHPASPVGTSAVVEAAVARAAAGASEAARVLEAVPRQASVVEAMGVLGE